MSSLLQSTAPHPNPRLELSTRRSGGIPRQPGAGMPSIPTRTRRHSLSTVRAALRGNRRTAGVPGSDRRKFAGNGVSPIAGGASRGVAIFVSR